FQAEDGIRDATVTGVQTCALPISHPLPTIRHRDGGAPAESTRSNAAPVGVVASPSTGPPPASSTPSSKIAVAGAGTGNFPCAARSEERRVGKECKSGWLVWLVKQ